MRYSLVFTVLLILLVTGCSLAEDVTPPPALATVQAAPLQPGTVPARPTVANEAPVAPSTVGYTPSTFNGARIYVESCEPCHGVTGLGDGSMSANLDVAIPALGLMEISGEAKPAEWYDIVTEGRMDRFMPPFVSLSDTQRWDVVAYALSLSYPVETRQSGGELYERSCASCHGTIGQGTDRGPALNASEGFASRSMNDIVEVIQAGKGEMPAFENRFGEDELVILAAHVQSLGTIVHGEAVAEQPSSSSDDPIASMGSIKGVVVNGTSGAGLPEGLDVSIVALEGNVPVFEETQPIRADGTFAMDGVEIVPGRIFGALVEYQDVVYYSVGGHLLEEAPQLELPLTIYETTSDDSNLVVDRLHLIFDFSLEGLVEVSELWLLSTGGDRTVVQHEGQNEIPITLPGGYSNLRFDTGATPELFSLTETGFLIHEPIRPGEPFEVVFSFTLPYERSLDFIQPVNVPIQAVVLLTKNDAPAIRGESVTDLGELNMGGMILKNYAMEALGAGEQVDVSLRGAHPLAQTNLTSSNLAIGLGVFGITLVGTGIALWVWQRRSSREPMDPISEQVAGQSRGELLQAIAKLDDELETGRLDRHVYEQRRAALKARIMERLPKDD